MSGSGSDVSWLGRRLELRVGPVAHGGHFVARYEGRVVFVRHAIAGELVTALVTEDRGGSYCHADAVEIHEADPDRVQQPCRYAHPGGCGGCDFQHVTLQRQRQLKGAVIAEQFQRLAGLEVDVEVQAATASETGLAWRRRVRYATTASGELGLRVHRSHDVVPIQRCPLGTAEVGDAAGLQQLAEPGTELEAAQGDDGEVAVLRHRQPPAQPRQSGGSQSSARQSRDRQSRGRQSKGRDRGGRERTELVAGPDRLSNVVAGRRFLHRAAGFWQTHPAAADIFTSVVSDCSALAPSGRVLELYAGSGLLTAALAQQVGSAGSVISLEGDPGAVEDARGNLADLPQADIRLGAVTPERLGALLADGEHVDAVVLDPPRTGAGAALMRAILACEPNVVVYVACDPAALARDVAVAMAAAWRLDRLHAFDVFPMTHHVECIATLRRAEPRLEAADS